MDVRLRYERMTKRFGGRVALDGLSLEVRGGEIFGFLGPNGAGKTTAIHLAMGFLRADSGRGELLGMLFEQARAARARVGYVPDAPVFFAGSAMDAVMLAVRLNGAENADAHRRARTLLAQLELPAAGLDAQEFSRGMQQRLALAQALVSRPSLLILDEPAAALDPPGVALVRGILHEARAEGTAVFFSSHQLQEVERLCDRVGFLKQGRLVRMGTLRELLGDSQHALVTLRGALHRLPEPLRASDGAAVYRVPVADQREFLERAWAGGAELVRVEREQQSLEELFADEEATR